MDAYKALAASYDRLTNDVDYKAVVDFYSQILEKEITRCYSEYGSIWI